MDSSDEDIFNFTNLINHLIRLKQLTNEQKKYILNLKSTQKDDIIFLYNDIVKHLIESMNDSFIHNNNFYK